MITLQNHPELPICINIFFSFIYAFLGFPGCSDGKEFTCSVGDLSWISGLRRFPGEGQGHPLQYPCLENPHG